MRFSTGRSSVHLSAVAALSIHLGLVTVGGQPPAARPYTTWSDYGGSADSMQYSALKQIAKHKVGQLELAWFYPVPDRKGNFGKSLWARELEAQGYYVFALPSKTTTSQ